MVPAWCVLLVLNAATPRAEVVLARRSGVATARAAEIVAAVAEVIRPSVDGAAPVDASACKGKRACLLEGARKRGSAYLITVEVGAALSEGSLRVELLSVEEDGRSLALAEADGPVESLVTRVRPALEARVMPALRQVLAPTPAPPPRRDVPEAPPASPPPVVAVPAPASAAPVAAVQASSAPATGLSGQKAGGLVVGAVGLVGLGIGAGFGAVALSGREALLRRCPAGTACSDPAAYGAWQNATQAQTIGAIAAGLGGAALVTGLVLFFAAPTSSTTVSLGATPLIGGAFADVRITFQ